MKNENTVSVVNKALGSLEEDEEVKKMKNDELGLPQCSDPRPLLSVSQAHLLTEGTCCPVCGWVIFFEKEKKNLSCEIHYIRHQCKECRTRWITNQCLLRRALPWSPDHKGALWRCGRHQWSALQRSVVVIESRCEMTWMSSGIKKRVFTYKDQDIASIGNIAPISGSVDIGNGWSNWT